MWTKQDILTGTGGVRPAVCHGQQSAMASRASGSNNSVLHIAPGRCHLFLGFAFPVEQIEEHLPTSSLPLRETGREDRVAGQPSRLITEL